TDTKRRSAAGDSGADADGTPGSAAWRAWPHSAQKRSPAAYGLAHAGQAKARPRPHFTQNFAPSRFSVLQLGHCMLSRQNSLDFDKLQQVQRATVPTLPRSLVPLE